MIQETLGVKPVSATVYMVMPIFTVDRGLGD